MLSVINGQAFNLCAITSVILPASISVLGSGIFSNTENVTFTGSGVIYNISIPFNNPFSSPQSLVDACTDVDTIEIPANGITYI